MALLDPPGRFPFHQIGQPLMPRYLWPLEQVFQPPLLALGIRFRWLECSSFRPVVDAQGDHAATTTFWEVPASEIGSTTPL